MLLLGKSEYASECSGCWKASHWFLLHNTQNLSITIFPRDAQDEFHHDRHSLFCQSSKENLHHLLSTHHKALCSTRLTCPIKAVSWVHKTFLTVLWNSWTDTNKIFCISNFLSKHFLPLPLFDITRKLFSHLRKYQPWSTGYEITSLSQNTTSF